MRSRSLARRPAAARRWTATGHLRRERGRLEPRSGDLVRHRRPRVGRTTASTTTTAKAFSSRSATGQGSPATRSGTTASARGLGLRRRHPRQLLGPREVTATRWRGTHAASASSARIRIAAHHGIRVTRIPSSSPPGTRSRAGTTTTAARSTTLPMATAGGVVATWWVPCNRRAIATSRRAAARPSLHTTRRPARKAAST